jgi:hypothetical protein
MDAFEKAMAPIEAFAWIVTGIELDSPGYDEKLILVFEALVDGASARFQGTLSFHQSLRPKQKILEPVRDERGGVSHRRDDHSGGA